MELGQYITGPWTFMIAMFLGAFLFVLVAKPLGDFIKYESVWFKVLVVALFYGVFSFVLYVIFT